MNKNVVITKVNNFLVEEFEAEMEELLPEANLKDTLELDSLDYIDLVVEVESEFGVKLVADDFTNIETFDSFYDLIVTKTS